MLQSVLNEDPVINVKDIVVPADDISDENIIETIKAGNIDAYGSIMRRYNQRMFRIARGIVTDASAAMDIVQEAHIKAYTKLNEYRGSGTLAAWLASITRNESLMYLRKHRREVVMPEDEIQHLEQEQATDRPDTRSGRPDATLESKQLQGLINQQLDKLPTNFRSVFICRAVEHFSVKETAEILDINEDTVKTRYFRAKRLLRDYLQSYLDTAGINIYEFGGHHCDLMVLNVLSIIHKRH